MTRALNASRTKKILQIEIIDKTIYFIPRCESCLLCSKSHKKYFIRLIEWSHRDFDKKVNAFLEATNQFEILLISG